MAGTGGVLSDPGFIHKVVGEMLGDSRKNCKSVTEFTQVFGKWGNFGRFFSKKRRPCQPDPSTRRSRCRCSLPGLTGFTGKTVWEDQQDRLEVLSQIVPLPGNRPVRFSVIV